MEGDPNKRTQIINTLNTKSVTKQEVYNNTFEVFNMLKDILHEMSGEINETIANARLVKVEYRDRGKFEAQIQIAGDMLIFSMHTNIFEFNREHSIWQNPYTKQDVKNSYCGIINIYDFLADSFKYNRSSDEGYLIGRIFINRERQFFVEGKRQETLKRVTSDYGKQLRMNRSIQVEGSFANIKEDMGFRRYLYRGKDKVTAQSILLAIGYNIKKLHHKIQSGRTGRHLFSLKRNT